MKNSNTLKKFITPDGKVIEFEANNDDEFLQKFIEYMNKHHPTNEEELMLNQAVDFHRVAGTLLPKSIDREGLKGKPAVFMVNASFGLEIYLKLAVKISTGKKKNGHQLQDLYKALSSNAKKEIEEILQKKIHNIHLNLEEPISAESFVSKLNKAFVAWRYKYERNDSGKAPVLNFYMIESIILLDVLNDYCRKHMKAPHSET